MCWYFIVCYLQGPFGANDMYYLVEELISKINQDPESARSYLSEMSPSDRCCVVTELVNGEHSQEAKHK